MADEMSALGGVREAILRLDQRLDVRDDVVRLGERIKQSATREEVNAGDFRVLKDVSDMMDRSTQAHNQYVRERVHESALETKNAMQAMEGRLTSGIASIAANIAALTVPPQQGPAQPGSGPDKRMHPAVAGTGGFTGGMAVLYLLLAFFNMVPRP